MSDQKKITDSPFDVQPLYINAINYFHHNMNWNERDFAVVNDYNIMRSNYGQRYTYSVYNSKVDEGHLNCEYNQLIMVLHDILNYGVVRPLTIDALYPKIK